MLILIGIVPGYFALNEKNLPSILTPALAQIETLST